MGAWKAQAVGLTVDAGCVVGGKSLQRREVFAADSLHQRLRPSWMHTARAECHRGDHGRSVAILIILLGMIIAVGYLGGPEAPYSPPQWC